MITDKLTITVIKRNWPIVVLDVVAMAITYFIPAIAHLTAIPFYVIEPFRIMVLISLVIMNNTRNAMALAITLPLFSFVITTHPLFAKAILISIEMVVNVVAYAVLIKKINKPFLIILVSIIISKLIYYLLKFGFISFGLLSMSLVSTSLLIQMIVALVTALLFCHLEKISK